MDIADQTVEFQEFLELEGPLEWVEGRVVPLAAVDLRHDDLCTWLAALLRFYVDANELGTVHQEPYVMRCAPGLPGRSPDILFVARRHRDRLKEKFLEGPADVAVEVVSTGSQVRDRGEKFYEYEKGGVGEFWLLDPLRRNAEFYALADEGLYQAIPVRDGVFRSGRIEGFWLREAWLWQQPLPKVNLVARELGI